MATLRQIRANRLNAQKSTGPRTEAGKRAASANAIDHGLAGEGLVLPDEVRLMVEQRKLDWGNEFQLDTPYAIWLFDRLALATVRAEVADRAEEAERFRLAQAAATAWEVDRRAEVETLAASLARDPARVTATLRRSYHGVEWLASRLESLAEIHQRLGRWDVHQNALALDLLGVPRDLRDGPTPLDPPDSDPEPESWPLRVVRAEAEALRLWQDEVGLDRDALDRSLAETGLGIESFLAVATIARYRTAADRTALWALRQLSSLGAGPHTAPAPLPPRPAPRIDPPAQPAPAPAPAPQASRPSAPPLEPPPQPSPPPATTPPPDPATPPLNRRARRAALARALRR